MFQRIWSVFMSNENRPNMLKHPQPVLEAMLDTLGVIKLLLLLYL